MAGRRRQRIETTDDFQEILPLCWWPESRSSTSGYVSLCSGGASITERAKHTGVSRRTLQRRIARFGEEGGMEGLLIGRRQPTGKSSRPTSEGSSWISRESTRPSTSMR